MSGTAQLTNKYLSFGRKLAELKEKGLSAAVYTQITDVETEANGLLTYDRAVIKPDAEKIAAANRFELPAATEVEIMPTAQTTAQTWRYTSQRPGEDWFKPEFDAASWKEGKSGFGTAQTPGAHVGTEWNTGDIWLRREVVLEKALKSPQLSVHHDEDVEVYINGVLALKAAGYVSEYELHDLTADGQRALKVGKNVIAVHCHQTGGGQYVDVGIVEVK
jgi:hypothetical protein